MRPRQLVTGAAGFIGHHLCHDLLDDGHDVIGIDAFIDSYDPSEKLARAAALTRRPGFSLVPGHLTELPLERTLEGVDVVYHLAGRAGVRASFEREQDYRHDNIAATEALVGASLRTSSVRRLVYASSSSVYGDAPVPFHEEGETIPVSPYGWTKLEAERLVLSADGSDLETVALRYFTVYGPGQRPDMALRIFAEGALSGRPLHVFGDGSQSRDFTYVHDIVDATRRAATAAAAGLAVNVGGGSRVTLTETLELLSRITARPLNLHHEAFAPGDARHTGADLTRARELLGFIPSTSLADGLAAEVAWIRGGQLGEQRIAA